MPISHTSSWYAVNDARIQRITADPAGGAATYGPLIDVPGVRGVSVSGDVTTAELRGDNSRLDQRSKLAGLSLTFEFAKLDLDIFSSLVGGAVADTGTGATERAEWALTAADEMSYFRFEGVTTGVDTVGGDGFIVLEKCILTSFPGLGFADEDYQTFSVDAAALPLLSTGAMLRTGLRATAAEIVGAGA